MGIYCIQLCNLSPNTKLKAKVPNYLNENNFKLHKCLVLSQVEQLQTATQFWTSCSFGQTKQEIL